MVRKISNMMKMKSNSMRLQHSLTPMTRAAILVYKLREQPFHNNESL